MTELKTYKDIYEFPLHNDNVGWVRDAKGQFVFQFEDECSSEKNQQQVVDIINGISEPTKPHNYVHVDGFIAENGKKIILIRGWGNLTGTGGHNLSPEEAANIQDTFAEFIVSRLNSTK